MRLPPEIRHTPHNWREHLTHGGNSVLIRVLLINRPHESVIICRINRTTLTITSQRRYVTHVTATGASSSHRQPPLSERLNRGGRHRLRGWPAARGQTRRQRRSARARSPGRLETGGRPLPAPRRPRVLMSARVRQLRSSSVSSARPPPSLPLVLATYLVCEGKLLACVLDACERLLLVQQRFAI